ncbi:hypothetical protein FRB95_012523 [Tulasnella sp. JGI-2019a]|nr:hypothetical protein FRB95_012523 [Tulasnella sp. JGI-2019a]
MRMTGMIESPSDPRPHQALLIPEILLHYFEYLSRREVADPALVCKKWSISLGVLWGDREVPLSVIIGRLHEISQSELCRSEQIRLHSAFFKQFAQKITQLDADQNITTDTAELLMDISSTLGTHLPNLRVLKLSAHDYPLPGPPRLFTSLITEKQHITNITIENHPIPEDSVSLLLTLGIATPHVRRFTLGVSDPEGNFEGLFYIDCSVFRQLRIAELNDLALEGWRPLVEGCCFLGKVTITVTRDESQSSEPHPEPPPVSASLEELTVWCSGYCYALATTVMPRLRALTFGDLSDDTDVTNLLGKRSPALETLEITYRNGDVGDTTLLGISSLTELRTVRLSGNEDSILFSDGAIDLLARSLPHLEDFSLRFRDFALGPPSLTGKSLESFFCHCLALKKLQLSVNLTDFPSSLTEAKPTGLERLTIYEAILPDDEEALRNIAKELVAWCPNVGRLRHGQELRYHIRRTSGWKDLARFFNHYQEFGLIWEDRRTKRIRAWARSKS